MQGTLINIVAVLIGSFIGLILHSKLPKKITTIVFQGIGLFTLFLGFNMALKTDNFLLMIFSIVIGSIIGEGIDIDKQLDRFSTFIKQKFKLKNEKFSEGFITAFFKRFYISGCDK